MNAYLTPADVSHVLQVSEVHARALMSRMDGVIDIGTGSRHIYRISNQLFAIWMNERQRRSPEWNGTADLNGKPKAIKIQRYCERR